MAEAESQRDCAEADREARAARTHEDSLAAMASLQASYDDSLARLRAAQEGEVATLRTRMAAAEEHERAAAAESATAHAQVTRLQVRRRRRTARQARTSTAPTCACLQAVSTSPQLP